MHQVYGWAGISRVVEVYMKGVGKSVIAVCKKGLKGQQTFLKAMKKTKKIPGLVIYPY